MKQNSLKITKETTIGQAIRMHPGALKVLQKYLSPHCVACPLSRMETIEQGALMHGQDHQIIDEIVSELNKLIGIKNLKKQCLTKKQKSRK